MTVSLEVRSLSKLFFPPCLPPLFSVYLLLFRGVPTSLSSSLALVLREHLTDVLFKDEKNSGGESKSKQHKNIHETTGKTLLYTHAHTELTAEALRIITSATLDTSGKTASAHFHI